VFVSRKSVLNTHILTIVLLVLDIFTMFIQHICNSNKFNLERMVIVQSHWRDHDLEDVFHPHGSLS